MLSAEDATLSTLAACIGLAKTGGLTLTIRTTRSIVLRCGAMRAIGAIDAFVITRATGTIGATGATAGAAMVGATIPITNAAAATPATAAAAGPSDSVVAISRPLANNRSMRSEICLRVVKTPGAGIG